MGGAKSLAVAMDYLEALGMDKILEYESALMNYAYDKMKKLDDVDIYTTSNLKRSPVLSFNIKDVHPHDVASILDHYHIAVRSGHHCAQPLHRSLGMNFSCRSFASCRRQSMTSVAFLCASFLLLPPLVRASTFSEEAFRRFFGFSAL